MVLSVLSACGTNDEQVGSWPNIWYHFPCSKDCTLVRDFWGPTLLIEAVVLLKQDKLVSLDLQIQSDHTTRACYL